ncbi:SDR family NAD(P)-dependent oxidoreductase [Nocardia sp. NBC_01730]|uniref:SDR family NAD(P)-dependent oxidoreductase n=1 Tax=Nocardia sp. NBC_01730 TaxID=2975998 RepID=UPI002E104C73|nr:SDR family NAD(P)-dependent oxidoreductase [Nocardia sp. NBC_01730]
MATIEGGEAIVRTALDTYGQVDILVNNAGILRDKPLHEMTTELLDPVIDVHLKGAFHVTRPTWRVMRERGYGRVINTTSAIAVPGTAGKSNYGAAKAGLLGLTCVLAAEGAEHNIKVNAVAPIAATRMLVYSMGGAEEIVSKLDPALVSPVVAFLAHADCSITGGTFTVGAGQVARFFTGRTRGYYDSALSAEDVRDHMAEICDETGYTDTSRHRRRGRRIAPGHRDTQLAHCPKTEKPRNPTTPRQCRLDDVERPSALLHGSRAEPRKHARPGYCQT